MLFGILGAIAKFAVFLVRHFKKFGQFLVLILKFR